jgi:hypothetical protein
MVKRMSFPALLCLLLALPGTGLGHASYTGYSGAPGTSGTCAGSCHGSSGGSITVSGFPSSYVPGQAYTISVRHASGSTIRQFNCSVRQGTGSVNAGVITAGTNSATYNTGSETNGVHLSSNSQDSCTFTWTAPAAGTGSVKLYFAGLQGSYSGQNTVFTQTAAEQSSGIESGDPPTLRVAVFGPNPFVGHTSIRFRLPADGDVRVLIYNSVGREVRTLVSDRMAAGPHVVVWDGLDNRGRRAAPGIYSCRLTTSLGTNTRKLVKLQ